MKRFLRMYRVEQRMFFRSPDVILFCLSMPLVTFIVIMLITGGKAAADSGLTYLESAYHRLFACLENDWLMATYGEGMALPVVGCLARNPNSVIHSSH